MPQSFLAASSHGAWTTGRLVILRILHMCLSKISSAMCLGIGLMPWRYRATVSTPSPVKRSISRSQCFLPHRLTPYASNSSGHMCPMRRPSESVMYEGVSFAMSCLCVLEGATQLRIINYKIILSEKFSVYQFIHLRDIFSCEDIQKVKPQ